MSAVALPKQRMSAEEFLAWSQTQAGRYELTGGEVFAQASERAAHAKIKFRIAMALYEAVRSKGLPCHVLPDGMAVRIDADTVFEPDAQLYCGPELPPDTILVESPVIVIEVLSPSTGKNDALGKLAAYFRLPSVAHYLIVSPDQKLIFHHARGQGVTILTRIVREGAIALDPPGLEIALADIYGE
ncbi:Uma2 family endonuclease [Methylocystis parvus]|uniref:Uma2 family endonuclease n=2 Tax=Methylocystis parvus TaxID=134 RepID=A0A6B8MAV5_9HYPH|nr:Uma2 family endonuclease [Methylocystis parvus]